MILFARLCQVLYHALPQCICYVSRTERPAASYSSVFTVYHVPCVCVYCTVLCNVRNIITANLTEQQQKTLPNVINF